MAETKTRFLCFYDEHNTLLYMFLKTPENKEYVQILLTDLNRYWQGKVTSSSLEAEAATTKKDVLELIDETVKVLCQKVENISFELDENCLVWKQKLDGIKVKLGSIQLELMSDGLTIFFNELLQGHQAVSNLKEQNEKLKQQNNNLLQQLDLAVAAKSQVEEHLFTQFVQVLNSKKRKIRLLQGMQVERKIDSARSQGHSEGIRDDNMEDEDDDVQF